MEIKTSCEGAPFGGVQLFQVRSGCVLDALAQTQLLLGRLDAGVYLTEDAAARRAEHEATIRQLYLRTQDQVRVLEAALELDLEWRAPGSATLNGMVTCERSSLPGSGTGGCLSQSRAPRCATEKSPHPELLRATRSATHPC